MPLVLESNPGPGDLNPSPRFTPGNLIKSVPLVNHSKGLIGLVCGVIRYKNIFGWDYAYMVVWSENKQGFNIIDTLSGFKFDLLRCERIDEKERNT